MPRILRKRSNKPKIIKEKDINKYRKCLLNYKNYLKDKFKSRRQEEKRLEREFKFIDDFQDNLYGGGVIANIKGKYYEKCVKKYAKELDREEKELKERLRRIKVEKINLKRTIKEGLE